MTDILMHLRHSVRLLLKAPGFTAAATLTLALGIGVNTTMFTVVHGVLLRPLPYPEPERLMNLVQAHNQGNVTIREFEFVREHARTLGSVAAYRGGGERRLGPAEDQNWISTIVVSTGFLRTLGVPLQSGREFTAEETRTGGPSSVILSHEIWRNVFAADPAIVGRTITLNGAGMTVIGVLPSRFWFPQEADALLPLVPTGGLSDTGTNTQMIARLAPDVAREPAQAELAAMTEPLRDAARGSLADAYKGLQALEYRDSLVGDVRLNLLLLLGATALLQVIACGNLALLLLTRFAARAREVAVRTALGSSPRRILVQLLTENLVLASWGTAAAIVAAFALVRSFVALMPFTLPASGPIGVNRVALAFTIATAFVTTIVVTLVPFLSSRRLDVVRSLRADGKNAGASAIRARTRNSFIVAEVALSTILFVAAGLLIQTLYRTTQQPLGFSPDGVLTFETPLAPERAQSAADRLGFTSRLLERLQQTPGVAAAAATNVLPLTGQSNLPTQRAGHPEQSIGGMEVRGVTADYFAVMGMPLRQGRSNTARDADTAAPVAVINETVARSWWPDGRALGDQLHIGRYQGQDMLKDVPREVIGIVGDTKAMSLQRAARPTVYVPITAGFGASSIAWVIKTGRGGAGAETIRAAVAAVDPGQRIVRLRMMDDIVASASARPRFNASLFAAFAAVALVLTIVGLYGVLSFLVVQRRHEIGTRIALGASRAHIGRAFVRQGLALTALGLGLGLAGAWFVGGWLSTLLFGVQAHDLTSLAGVAVVVLAIGGAASYLPARRAAAMDPLVAMRAE